MRTCRKNRQCSSSLNHLSSPVFVFWATAFLSIPGCPKLGLYSRLALNSQTSVCLSASGVLQLKACTTRSGSLGISLWPSFSTFTSQDDHGNTLKVRGEQASALIPYTYPVKWSKETPRQFSASPKLQHFNIVPQWWPPTITLFLLLLHNNNFCYCNES